MMNHLSSKLSGCSRILLIPCLVLLQTLAVLPLLASAGDLRVGGYQLVSQVRVGRTTFDYTYRATVENSGAIAYAGVSATLVSTSPYTTVIDGSLNFGDTGIGAKGDSTDTFKIRVDRLYPFSEAALRWTISAQRASPTVTLDTANQESAVIGPAGGSIIASAANGTKFTLSIPAGALRAPLAVEMTPISRMEGLPLTGQVIAAVRLEPTGVRFAKPATLLVEATAPFDASPFLVGFTVHDDGSGYSLMPATLAGNRANIPVEHFSSVGLLMAVDHDGDGTLQSEIGSLLLAKYYGTGGVRDTTNNLSACYGPQFNNAAQQVLNYLAMTQMVPGDIDICGFVDGTNQCFTAGYLYDATVTSLTNAIVRVFSAADLACVTNPAAEAGALACIGLADEGLDTILDPSFPSSTFANTLIANKQCGLASFRVDPDTACVVAGSSVPLNGLARNHAGNLLPGREVLWQALPPAPVTLAPTGNTVTVTGVSTGNAAVWGVDRMAYEAGAVRPGFASNVADMRVEGGRSIDPPIQTAIVGGTVAFTINPIIANSPVTGWEVASPNIAALSLTQTDLTKTALVRGVSPGSTQLTASTACQESAATATVTVLDMNGSWHGWETWESSTCPATTLEVHNCTVSQVGNQLNRYCRNYYTGGLYTFTGTFSGPAFQWTLNYPAQWGPHEYTLSANESGTVSPDGMNYSSTIFWTFTYADENGTQQVCNGASGSQGVRVLTP